MTVDLVPSWMIGDVSLTSYPFGVDADSTVDIGEPEMVVEGVTSMLADGDLERVVRHGNRTYVLEVYIEGPTLADLAASEAVLRQELRRSGLLLTHDPGDGFSPVSVYEVQTARLTPQRRDDHESHLIRKFTLTLTCAPFARSADLTTVAAYTSGVTTVSVDTCSSATSWTGTRSGASWPVSDTWEAGSVTVVEVDSATTSPERWTLTRTGSVDFTTTPHLVVEVKTLSFQQGVRVSATAGGVSLPLLANFLLADGSSYSRLTFDATGLGVVPSITLSHDSLPGESIQGLFVRQVSRSDVSPNVTSRQLTRIVHTGGTERTPASIQVTPAAGESAGLCIVHTSPEDGSGYFPAMRRWRTSGNTPTTDAATMSGAREVVNTTPTVAQIPISAVPEGGYTLAAFMRSSVAGSFEINWHARTLLNGSYLGGPLGTAMATFTDVNAWTFIPLGVVTLPPVRAAAGFVQVNLSRVPEAAEVIDLDEWWALRTNEDCALTVTAGGAFVWLDSPDTSSAVPRVWIGANGDRSDARHPGNGLLAQGNHVLHPAGTSVFVGASGLAYPGLTAAYHKRWHSNAAE